MHNTETLVRTGRLWLWLAISVMILLLASSAAAAQGRNAYYLAVGPAFTSSSDWGSGHKVGTAVEVGIIHPIATSWGLVGAVGMERFQRGAPQEGPACLNGSGDCIGTYGPVSGGNDYVVSLRGGVRRDFVSSTRIKPYVGALLGLTLAHQDRATTDEIVSDMVHPRTLQDNNNQLAPAFSGIVGVNTVVDRGYRVFLESGFTYVYTPDDSFNDNPAFFPVRVGVIF